MQNVHAVIDLHFMQAPIHPPMAMEMISQRRSNLACHENNLEAFGNNGEHAERSI